MNENKVGKIITINSLSDYILAIQKNDLNDCISRGENRKFPNIMAASFRPFKKYRKTFNVKHLDEFFNCVGNELSPMQSQHFLAFAQHSGLPTHLIDFTTSPLISLFFAVYSETTQVSTNKQCAGYVYFIRKNNLHDVGHLLSKDYRKGVFYWLVSKDELGLIYDLQKDEDTYGCTDTFKFPMLTSYISFIKSLLSLFEGLAFNNNSVNKIFSEIIEWDLEQHQQQVFEFMKCLNDCCIAFQKSARFSCGEDARIYNSGDQRNHTKFCIAANGNFLLTVQAAAIMYKEYIKVDKQFQFPYYCSYTPPNINSRIKIQQSIFLSQMYIANDAGSLATQEILPDFTIEIENPKEILKELDLVGINEATVYGDYDNIAKYIKDKMYLNSPIKQ